MRFYQSVFEVLFVKLQFGRWFSSNVFQGWLIRPCFCCCVVDLDAFAFYFFQGNFLLESVYAQMAYVLMSIVLAVFLLLSVAVVVVVELFIPKIASSVIGISNGLGIDFSWCFLPFVVGGGGVGGPFGGFLDCGGGGCCGIFVFVLILLVVKFLGLTKVIGGAWCFCCR